LSEKEISQLSYGYGQLLLPTRAGTLDIKLKLVSISAALPAVRLAPIGKIMISRLLSGWNDWTLFFSIEAVA
jgi:hypothetical protein